MLGLRVGGRYKHPAEKFHIRHKWSLYTFEVLKLNNHEYVFEVRHCAHFCSAWKIIVYDAETRRIVKISKGNKPIDVPTVLAEVKKFLEAST